MLKFYFKSRTRRIERLEQTGFTLTEILIAVALTAVLASVLFAALSIFRQTAATSTAEQSLQQQANVILSKIIKGSSEPAGTFRLSEAVSYQIINTSELHFNGKDGIERIYSLNQTGTSLLYNHPTAAGTVDEVIYTVPAGSTLTVRFWVLSGTQYTNVTLGIDVGLSQASMGRTVTGSATTMINIRNHPV